MDVHYCKDWDSDTWVYACVGLLGFDGLLRIGMPLTAQSKWEWIPRHDPYWDALHQKIFRNHKTVPVQPDVVASLPPLPDPSTKPPPLAVDETIHSGEYPALSDWLKKYPDHTAVFYVVLLEDRYESLHGDGEFHYFDAVFTTEELAKEYIGEENPHYRLHLRQLKLTLDGDVLLPDFETKLFDHVHVSSVLRALENSDVNKKQTTVLM